MKMLDSLFITLLIIAIILEIITVYEESLVFSMLALVFWITLMGASLGIEVPFVVSNISGGAPVEGSHTYSEMGMSGLCLAFVIINLVLLVIYVMEFRRRGKRVF